MKERLRGIAPGVVVKAGQTIELTSEPGVHKVAYFEGDDVCVMRNGRKYWHCIDEIVGYSSPAYRRPVMRRILRWAY